MWKKLLKCKGQRNKKEVSDNIKMFPKTCKINITHNFKTWVSWDCSGQVLTSQNEKCLRRSRKWCWNTFKWRIFYPDTDLKPSWNLNAKINHWPQNTMKNYKFLDENTGDNLHGFSCGYAFYVNFQRYNLGKKILTNLHFPKIPAKRRWQFTY